MEKFIKDSEKDGMERGFTFRTNEDAKIEEICLTGSQCQMINRMFISINEFITELEPNIDKNKISQKTEALLRSYPSTLVSDLNKTEKWYLFNNIAHLFLTMAIDSIES